MNHLKRYNGSSSHVFTIVTFEIGEYVKALYIDGVVSLPDSARLVTQFTAMALMFWNLGIMHWEIWWMVVIALIVCVGATNVINFMDGINGITAGYSLAVLGPLAIINMKNEFIDQNFLMM